MYIKEVVIDGFKSYANRTVVEGFDTQFNAITGLNGSGKSNILDAICFVLGIKNLSQVRANNLQELVYKCGQANVQKASVSIKFDNGDKNQSPVGYDQYEEITITRQVVIGGRNKYLINGVNAQNNRVEDLFRSVQMNVNNPHFIIMQGRITKVLNMKPPEILSMIEEAAGTKMYESKKQMALKTIEKKDAKLKEIDTMLKEEITPTLEKLKEERTTYLEFQKTQREYEHFSQLVIAHQYCTAMEVKTRSRADIEESEKNIEICTRRLQQNQAKSDQLQNEIKILESSRDEVSGDTLSELEANHKERQKEEAKLVSKLDSQKDELKGREKSLKTLMKNIDNQKKLVVDKRKEYDDLQAKAGGSMEKGVKDREELEAAQKQLQALAVGLSTNEEGQEATLANQLMSAKEEISRKQTEFKQADLKLKHLRTELQKHQSKIDKSDTDFSTQQKKLANLEKECADLKASLDKFANAEELEETLRHQKRDLENEITRFKDDMNNYNHPNLNFTYTDPEPGFDRSKVHGLVANLVELKSPDTVTAIDVAAGQRLWNVVVDNEDTGKKLLERGKCKRVTLIPLSKIAAQCINTDVIKKAKNLVGKENVDLALTLVGYEKAVTKAMEFVFGNTFVCKNMNVAKRITFEEIRKRSVTLDGESFNPEGTLSGGAKDRGETAFQMLQNMNRIKRELNEKQRQAEDIGKQFAEQKSRADERRRINQKFETKKREVDSHKDKLEQTAYHQVVKDIRRIEGEITEAEQMKATSTEMIKKLEDKAAELEHRMKNADAYRETERKNAEKRLADAKKRVDQSDSKSKENQQISDALKLEISEIETELSNYETQLSEMQKTVDSLKMAIDKSIEMVAESKQLLKTAEEKLNQQKDILKARNKEINAKSNEKDELLKDSRKVELKMKEFNQKIERIKTDGHDALKKIDQMKAAYPWIGEQEQFFGKHGTAFDFSSVDFAEAAKRLQNLAEKKEKLSRTINARAMNMFTQAEHQYNDLLKKKRIVEQDKEKIASVIEELDEKKKRAVEEASERVNVDFGSIFSTLLPGTKAKLEPPPGQSVLDGLEVRIAFGDVWKESLAELSGGQRSLIALSLILAMLKFKPAPIYILDEVDAALDVSHTQNIGRMLHLHFRTSQFVVVSLKEGMFGNANVLFRTRFVEGKSTVSRHVQRRHSLNSIEDGVEAAAPPGGNEKNKKQKRK